MNQKWILVILVFSQNMTSGAGEEKTVKEGSKLEMTCTLNDKGSLVVWFRVLATGIEFIASFTNNGILKFASNSFASTFTNSLNRGILTLKSFNKTRDSGSYICASLIKGVELKFSDAIRLVGEKVATEAPQTTPRTSITAPNQCTTATPCVCKNNGNNKQGETSPQMFCSPIILGPLAGGCGLLLLLLIITILYCNQMRTRRCPHHYKRKPQLMAPGKQMMTNRHV